MLSVINLIIRYKAILWLGLKVTIIVSIAALLLGMILGTLLAVMRTRKNKILQLISTVYVELIRGTPVMIQLVMVYYGASIIGIHFPSTPILGSGSVNGVTSDRLIAAIIGLGLNSAALICEIVRSGIQSIERGQTEAALSIGMNSRQTMFKIILPQAVRNILPALGNEFVNMIKTSSQVTILGLADLMYVSSLIRGQSYRPFAPFVIVFFMYFILTFTTSNLVKKYEKHLNRSRN